MDRLERLLRSKEIMREALLKISMHPYDYGLELEDCKRIAGEALSNVRLLMETADGRL